MTGHFARVCLKTKRKTQANTVRTSVDETPQDRDSDDDYVYSIRQYPTDFPKCSIQLNTCHVQVMIDSGTSVNILATVCLLLFLLHTSSFQYGAGRGRRVASHSIFLLLTHYNWITVSAFYGYDRSELLLLRLALTVPIHQPDFGKLDSFSQFLVRSDNGGSDDCARPAKRKRGKRGGLLVKPRLRKNHPVLPSLVLANVQRLYNKMDELQVRIDSQRDYRECCVFIVSETWLTSDHPDSALEPPGFTIFRNDRSSQITGKSQGGEVCFLVNKAGCTDTKVISSYCAPDLETLTIKCRPFFLPRDFGSIILTAVYIHPRANVDVAISSLSGIVTQHEYPNSLSIVSGDFNKANLRAYLPKYKQQVTCPTRGNKTLEMLV